MDNRSKGRPTQLTAVAEDTVVDTTVEEEVDEEKVKNKRTEKKAKRKNQKEVAAAVDEAAVDSVAAEEGDDSVDFTGEEVAEVAHVQNPKGMTERAVR